MNIKNMWLFVVIAFAFPIINGCGPGAVGAAVGTAKGPVYKGEQFEHEEPEENSATIYVYRYPMFGGSGRSPLIYVDGKEIDKFANGGYYSFKVNPGKHIVETEGLFLLSSATIELDAFAGSELFVRFDIGNFSSMTLMEKESGIREIQETRLQKSIDLTLN